MSRHYIKQQTGHGWLSKRKRTGYYSSLDGSLRVTSTRADDWLPGRTLPGDSSTDNEQRTGQRDGACRNDVLHPSDFQQERRQVAKKGPMPSARPRPPGRPVRRQPTATYPIFWSATQADDTSSSVTYTRQGQPYCRPPRNCFSTNSMTSDGPACLCCDGSGRPRSAR